MFLTTNTGVSFLLDEENYYRFKEHLFSYDGRYIRVYFNRNNFHPYRRWCYLHRLIFMEHQLFNLKIDHINMNKLDNRVCNLRIVTTSINSANKPAIGYHECTRYGKTKYKVEVKKDKKKYFIGRFDTKKEAIDAYLSAKKEIYGDFFVNNPV